MSAQNDGGPAFPSHGSMGEVVCEGMTLRDYFAAKAMQGYCAVESTQGHSADDIAAAAYSIADAMLAARVEPNT